MYHYPFSNVYDDLRVCVGNNVLPHFKSQTQLSKFPRFLLGIPNNDDFSRKAITGFTCLTGNCWST